MRRPHWRFGDLRLVLVSILLVAAWVGIGYRLFLVQGADAAELAQRGFDQRVRHEVIEPNRGTVFDRDGVELAISVGTAKPMPTLPPVRLIIAELTPTSSPRMLTSAPPELPGLIDASVWMKSS